jgi:hypothetical protein
MKHRTWFGSDQDSAAPFAAGIREAFECSLTENPSLEKTASYLYAKANFGKLPQMLVEASPESN